MCTTPLCMLQVYPWPIVLLPPSPFSYLFFLPLVLLPDVGSLVNQTAKHQYWLARHSLLNMQLRERSREVRTPSTRAHTHTSHHITHITLHIHTHTHKHHTSHHTHLLSFTWWFCICTNSLNCPCTYAHMHEQYIQASVCVFDVHALLRPPTVNAQCVTIGDDLILGRYPVSWGGGSKQAILQLWKQGVGITRCFGPRAFVNCLSLCMYFCFEFCHCEVWSQCRLPPLSPYHLFFLWIYCRYSQMLLIWSELPGIPLCQLSSDLI